MRTGLRRSLLLSAGLFVTGALLAPDLGVAPPPAFLPRPAGAHSTGGDRSAGDGRVWRRLRHCETGGRYSANSGNGHYGAYQLSARTWRGLGYRGLPHQATPAIQDEAARKLQRRRGWGEWPACSRRLGLG